MTGKKHYIGSQQVAPIVIMDDVVTDGVEIKLIEIDNGKAPRNAFEDERPLGDGMRYRGGVWGPRTGSWVLMASVRPQVVSQSNMEAVRDDVEDWLSKLLISETGIVQLKVERVDASHAAVSRILDVIVLEQQGWKWSPRDLADGHVGHYSQPIVVKTIPWRASFPWWRDEDTTDTAELTLDGTLRTSTIENLGDVPCGIALNVEGSSATGLDVAVLNATVGGSPGVVGAAGIVLQDIDLHATNGHYVDQFVADPQRFQAYREANGASIRDKLAPRPRVWLARGINTLSRQVTAGSVSGGETVQYFFRNWWGSP